MSSSEAGNGQLIDDLWVDGLLTVRSSGGSHRPDGDPGRQEAGATVDVTDGGWAENSAPPDGAHVAAPSLPHVHPVLGATLRPPLTGTGHGQAVGAPEPPATPHRSAAGAVPMDQPAPLQPAVDRFSVPEGYPPSAPSPYPDNPSPYLDLSARWADIPGMPVTGGVPVVPGPVDPHEQELWFHPRSEHPAPAEPSPVPPSMPAADPSTVAISLPVRPSAPFEAPAGPQTVPPAGPPAGYDAPTAYPSLPTRPAPREAVPVPVDLETTQQVRPLSRRARRAAEYAAEHPVDQVTEPMIEPMIEQAADRTATEPRAWSPEPSAAAPAVAEDELPELVDSDDWLELPSYARPASVATHPAPLPPLPVAPLSPSALSVPSLPSLPSTVVPPITGPSPFAAPGAAPFPAPGVVGSFGPAAPTVAPAAFAGQSDVGPPPVVGPPPLLGPPPVVGSPAATSAPPVASPVPSPSPAPPISPLAPSTPPPIGGPVGLFPGVASAPEVAPGAGAAPAPYLPPPAAAAAYVTPPTMPSPSPPMSPSDAPFSSPPSSVTGEQAVRPRSQSGPSTASIPVIRPPVQVRRPDEDAASATAETRSLRVTPPDAKAMFRSPSGPANAVAPAPAPAPPRPMTPKASTAGDTADPARTRSIVVIPAGPLAGGAGSPGSATWAPTAVSASSATSPVPTAPPAAPAVPAAPAPPPPPPPSTQLPAPSGPSMRTAAPPPSVPPAPDSGSSDWLGDLRGDDAAPAPGDRSAGPQPWGPRFGTDQAAAATIVPVRGRAAKRQRKAADKARKAEANATIKSMRRTRGSDPTPVAVPPPAPAPLPVPPAFEADAAYAELDDLDESDRSRWVSLLVFWAPALILLLLAGVVIWLVR